MQLKCDYCDDGADLRSDGGEVQRDDGSNV